jgi:hypothetical protein
MSHLVQAGRTGPPTAELRAVLEQALAEHFGRPCRIARLRRHLSDYSTSFALEELDVRLEDGRRLALIFKDLSRQRLLDGARLVKPVFLYDPVREIETYRRLLAPDRLGTAVCYGAVVDQEAGRYWLFLERVCGQRLSFVGELSTWERVAGYLARLHACFADRPGLPLCMQEVPLIRYDRQYYRLWLERALGFVRAARGGVPAAVSCRLERLAGNYDRVVGRLSALPVTLIHGEFYAENVLVHQAGGAWRVCPVDWEMAAVGPGLIDLAALVAGGWSADQRLALVTSYYRTLASEDGQPMSFDDFLAAADLCELHLSVQWLGWSPVWAPPAEEARGWLEGAFRLGTKLGLC